MMNNDYILRSDIQKAIGDWFLNDGDKRSMMQVFEDIPAADVESRRESGMWIEQPDRPNVESDRIYRCSVCGYADEHSPTTEVPYCWHCGSRMRKMQKEDSDATY